MFLIRKPSLDSALVIGSRKIGKRRDVLARTLRLCDRLIWSIGGRHDRRERHSRCRNIGISWLIFAFGFALALAVVTPPKECTNRQNNDSCHGRDDCYKEVDIESTAL